MLRTTRNKLTHGDHAPRPHDESDAAVAVLQKTGTLTRWGNSLGLRIPNEGVRQLGLKAGESVSVEIGAGAITIRPARRRRQRWTLDALLKGVTPEIVRGEVDWGGPLGKEML